MERSPLKMPPHPDPLPRRGNEIANMAEKNLAVPEPGVREMAHDMALKLARQRLAAITDIEKQCANAGARYLPDRKSIALVFLGRRGLPGRKPRNHPHQRHDPHSGLPDAGDRQPLHGENGHLQRAPRRHQLLPDLCQARHPAADRQLRRKAGEARRDGESTGRATSATPPLPSTLFPGSH